MGCIITGDKMTDGVTVKERAREDEREGMKEQVIRSHQETRTEGPIGKERLMTPHKIQCIDGWMDGLRDG